MKSKNPVFPWALALLPVLAVIPLAGGCGSDNNEDNLAQIDRMGIPAINTALIPSGQKLAFNQGDPSTDVSSYLATVKSSIDGLRTAVGNVSGFPAEDSPGVDSGTLAGIVMPDVLTVNFAVPTHFPNGRALEDDVIDAELGLVLNRGKVLTGGGGVSDAIANDSAFGSSFPYLAAPN